jgi:hypothetical protein
LIVSFCSSKPETIRFNDVLDGEQSAHSYYLQSSRLLDEIDGRRIRETNIGFLDLDWVDDVRDFSKSVEYFGLDGPLAIAFEVEAKNEMREETMYILFVCRYVIGVERNS